MALGWSGTSNSLDRMGWVCGYCGKSVGGNVGFERSAFGDKSKLVYICPHCENPTAFIQAEGFGGFEQYPSAQYGADVDGLPESVGALYDEIRRCVQYTAYTSAALSIRKQLMNVAVDKGAEPGKNFAHYVDYLADSGWIPPNGRGWVDELRKGGNEVAHEIAVKTEREAHTMLDFSKMLLRFAYEFPARVRSV